MKTQDIKQIRDAFARLSKGVKITEFESMNTIKIETDFQRFYPPSSITIYAYMVPPSKKIYFTDAGNGYKQLTSSDQKIQDGVVNALINSYGLIMLPDHSIVDQQDEPLHDRIANILAIQIGIDAMTRTWAAYSNKVKTQRVTENIEEPDDIL